MMFALARQLPAADASTQAGKWEKNRFMGVELYGKTLGLIGAGNIGSIVADRANGLKMHVIAYDPFLSPERAVEIGRREGRAGRSAGPRRLHHPAHPAHRQDPQHPLGRGAGQDQEGRADHQLRPRRTGRRGRRCARRSTAARSAAPASTSSSSEPAKENLLFGAPNFVATPHLGASTNEAQENVALQVAEQMSDYLLTGAVTNALNSPSVTADEAPKLKPFVALAEKLGAFAGQMVDVGLKGVDIAYEGDVAALNVRPLTAAALAGFLRPMLSEVNMVSAPAVAKERGITVSEVPPGHLAGLRQPDPHHRDHRDGPRARSPAPWSPARRGSSRSRAWSSTPPFAPPMLYVNNQDKPGFIGALGALLGEAGVNIATFNLGRVAAGEDAIALVGVDQAPDDGPARPRSRPCRT